VCVLCLLRMWRDLALCVSIVSVGVAEVQCYSAGSNLLASSPSTADPPCPSRALKDMSNSQVGLQTTAVSPGLNPQP
jgi:hypothetical protein